MDSKYTKEEKKAIVTYTVELGVFALFFITLGILQLCGVINLSDRFLSIFQWVTLFGASLIIVMFVIGLIRRKKSNLFSMFDRISLIPAGLYAATLDILLLSGNQFIPDNRRYFIAPLFIYIALAYTAQAIYHYKHPIAALFEDDKKKEADVIDVDASIKDDDKE